MNDGILYHGDCLDVLRAFPDAKTNSRYCWLALEFFLNKS